MSKTVRRILTAAILLAVPFVLLCFAFLLPPQYDGTYLAALQDKNSLLKTAESPRIVLIGGSGAAFDVRSDLLEKELPGYRVVNYGLYAGLGTAVMLDLAEPYIRSGDIVVFLPEQNSQTLSTFFDAASLWQASDGTVPPLFAISGDDLGAMAGAFGRYAASKARLFFTGTKPASDAVYARASFNAYGDISCAGREQNIMADGYDPNTPIVFDPALPTEDLAARLNAFCRRIEKKGAMLYFGFCPINASAITDAEGSRMDAYTAALNEKLDCPLLGVPLDAVMDEGWFFDTNFHLNEAGQIVYTARLAALLKNVTGDVSSVSIELPAMPERGTIPVLNGDSADAGCFLYEPYADGVMIAALSDAGKTRERLTVPALYDGLPVRYFAPSVFAGNDTLRSVTIGPNVTWIADGSFSGCSQLERITLVRLSPSGCSVGQGLLDGTSALIAIPSSAYSAYATDYFWSPYASSMVPSGDLG